MTSDSPHASTGAPPVKSGDAFLRNAWYVAGWAGEIDDGALLGRLILGDPVVMFRTEDGVANALGDRCPHRFAPLHRGVLKDGQIRCGYHGLGFDRTGQCVHNPHGPAKAVRALSVPVYPIAERQGLLWIWMGDADRADVATIPHYECLDPDRFFVGRGYLRGDAHYELMVDNILDLSHIQFLHPRLGTDRVAEAQVNVTQTPDGVLTTRRMTGEHLPAGLAKVYRAEGQVVDRTMAVEWRAPANLLLSIIIEMVNDGPFPRTGSHSLHLFTPETERSAHYFFTGSLPRETAEQAHFDAFFGALSQAFVNEDKPMIDAQQKMIGDGEMMAMKPALLPIDRAAVLARRALAKRIAEEREQESTGAVHA